MTAVEQAVTVAVLATMLNCSTDTVYRMARSKRIPGFKVGSDWRFYPSAVNEALNPPVDLWAPPRRGGRRAA